MNLVIRAMSTIRRINAFFEACESRFNPSLAAGQANVKGTCDQLQNV